METEFVALAAAGKEAEWLKNLLLEIPLWVKPMAHISIHCDSAVTLAKAYSQMYNGKSRHLGVRHSMIHELITNGVVSIEFVRMILELVEQGPLLWPSVKEDGVTRIKKYSELTAAEAIQADYDVNTKFLNILPSEWSKFVTDVKRVRDLHTTNVDQLHAYLGQHEYHANKVR
nr:zinc finger, CCHC-type [Tanacetum cinerariifolium]